MKVKQIYVADDGTEFDDRNACIAYDDTLQSTRVICYDINCNVVDWEADEHEAVKLINIMSDSAGRYLAKVNPFKIMPPTTKGWYLFIHDDWMPFDKHPKELYEAITDEAKYYAKSALCMGKFLEMQFAENGE